MNLQPVSGPPFTAECCHCHQRKCFGGSPALPFAQHGSTGYADLDGKAFEDYYCRPCAIVVLCENKHFSEAEAI